jgi:hypothetical protein
MCQQPNKYISKYSNGKLVSPAQYITEIICEQKAKIDKEDLHYKFWLSKKWNLFYRNQIASANKLLKKYSAKAIINALLSDHGKKIFSLRAPHLIPIIDYEEAALKSQNSSLSKHIERKENVRFNKSKKDRNNILSKLEDIDNGS